ncbi:MAG: hypothetical protein M3177_01985, partial [Pseudomonadota bacterium]|nr:hypothetical protein [Pseudomonadota bacterium]
LIFFSNYGGSWESYLVDFITKAHSGLTAVWSNTEGFPRASNLFLEGATDGEPFKRWARRQQRPTAFWYSAYPSLTTDRIRSNAAIRQGLAAASTEDEAKAWLANLGSRIPPPTLLDTPEIQTLLFGGLKRHPYATCLLLALPESKEDARAWLRRVNAAVTFGDQPDPLRVTQLALSASGLQRLGLRPDQLAPFPYAFRAGMANPVRSNILSDTGDDKPDRWIWGSGAAPVDVAMLIYTAEEPLLEAAAREEKAALKAIGGYIVHEVRLRRLGDQAQQRGVGRRNQEFEAFGFADGVSQPIIKGTRRWTKATDRLHEVEPGEFLLGYPDNRGGRPLSPTIRSEDDPNNLLSVANPGYAGAHYPCFDVSGANSDRDLGLNGSYLVIRQLAQDVEAFDRSVAEAADQCAGHAGMPPGLNDWQRREWVAAKMVGRWRDGTSLVRYPHRPGTGWNERSHKEPGGLGTEPDNGFLLGAEDPVGHRCPFGSHIRRTNPRESMDPGSMEQLDITNRHRILRVGRRFDGYMRDDGVAEREGLLFMCLNGDIERQFEFIQQTWAFAMQFMGVENEVDAILGRGSQEDDRRERKTARLTIPTPHGPIYVRDLKDVVQVRGGGYFFLPSRSALAWLAA